MSFDGNKTIGVGNKLLKFLRFGGEFADQTEEHYFQKSNWKDISNHARNVLTIGIIVLGLLSILEWMQIKNIDDRTLIVYAAAPILFYSIALVFLYKSERFYNHSGLSLLVLAFLNSSANSFLLMSHYALWNYYITLVLGQILFFVVFLPNRFKYTLASVVLLVFSYIYVGTILVGNVIFSEVSLLTIAVAITSIYYKYYLNNQHRRFYVEEKKLEKQVQDADYSRGIYEENAAKNINLLEQLAIAEQEAKKNSQFLKAVLDHIHQGIIVFDNNYKLVAWNTPLESLLDIPDGFLKVGMAQEELLEFNAKRGEYGDGDCDEMVRAKMRMIQASKGRDSYIYDRTRPDGTIMNVIGTSLPDGGIISSYTDVTKEREREEETRLKSLRDSLTQLSNRRAFEADLNSAYRQSGNGEKPFVLAMIDLDNFKPVNDNYGHPVGDAVLKEVAEILNSHIRGTDSASRIGGDEFAIIFRNVNDLDLIEERVNFIIKAIGNISIDGCDEMSLGASAGLAQHIVHAEGVDELMELSDKALYAAKHAGKNTVVVAFKG